MWQSFAENAKTYANKHSQHMLRIQTADKPQMRRKYLPSPVRGRGIAAPAVVDEVAKNSIST